MISTEILTYIVYYAIILGALIFIFKRIKDFDEESRNRLRSVPLEQYTKMMEDFQNEFTSKKTKQDNSSETVGITRKSRKTKRVQKGVRKTIRRSKSPSRKRDAGTAKGITGNRRRVAKKV